MSPKNVKQKEEKVKEEKPEAKTTDRVRTGIPGLDEVLGGGLKLGSVTTVTGDSGCGKTTLALQYLYAGATQYGEPGMHITFEEDKNLLISNLKGFGWDFEKQEKARKLVFYEYPPQEAERFVSQEAIIHDVIDEFGVKRVTLDSITSLQLLYKDEYERKREMVRLLGKLRKWKCTILFTAESSVETEGHPQARFGISNLTDGLIYLYNLRKGNSRQRALEVIKLRGIDFQQKICPLRFTKNGIAIYPSEQVYE